MKGGVPSLQSENFRGEKERAFFLPGKCVKKLQGSDQEKQGGRFAASISSKESVKRKARKKETLVNRSTSAGKNFPQAGGGEETDGESLVGKKSKEERRKIYHLIEKGGRKLPPRFTLTKGKKSTPPEKKTSPWQGKKSGKKSPY